MCGIEVNSSYSPEGDCVNGATRYWPFDLCIDINNRPRWEQSQMQVMEVTLRSGASIEWNLVNSEILSETFPIYGRGLVRLWFATDAQTKISQYDLVLEIKAIINGEPYERIFSYQKDLGVQGGEWICNHINDGVR